jgi:hypothetical protein
LRRYNSDPLWVHGGRAREARSEREQVEEQDEQEETAMSASEYSGAGKHGRGGGKVRQRLSVLSYHFAYLTTCFLSTGHEHTSKKSNGRTEQKRERR